MCFAALKCVFGMDRTLAKTLTGLVTRIAAKVTAYTYGFYVNRFWAGRKGASRSCGPDILATLI